MLKGAQQLASPVMMSAAPLGTCEEYEARTLVTLLAVSLRSLSRSRSGTNSEEGHLPPLTSSFLTASTTGITTSSCSTLRPLLHADAARP